MRPNIRRQSGRSCVAFGPYPRAVCVYLASLLRTRKQMALWGLRKRPTVEEDEEAENRRMSKPRGIGECGESPSRSLPEGHISMP